MRRHALGELLHLMLLTGLAWALAVLHGFAAAAVATLAWGCLAILGAALVLWRGALDQVMARVRRQGRLPVEMLPLQPYLLMNGMTLLAFVYAGWFWPAAFQLIYGCADVFIQRHIRVYLEMDAVCRAYTKGRRG